MIRKVDPLGRIVIPKEIRKTLNFNESDPIEIFVDDQSIVLKKYYAHGSCVVTGEVLESNVEYVPGLILSPDGATKLMELIASNQKKTS